MRKHMWFPKAAQRALDSISEETGWNNVSGMVREGLILLSQKIKEDGEESEELRRRISIMKQAEDARN